MFALRWLHRWIGLAVLPLFLLACTSGTLLVFQKPLIRLVVTPTAEMPVSYSIDQLAIELEQLVQHPLFDTRQLIKAPSVEEPFWSVRGDGKKILLSIGHLERYERGQWLIDGLEWLRQFHIELLAGTTGKILLLIVVLVALLMCVTGAIVWWPMRRIYHWSWVLPPRSKWRLRYMIRFHSHSSFTVLPLLMVVLLCAAVMMWNKVDHALAATGSKKSSPVLVPQSISPDYVNNIGAALKRAHRALPHSWPTYIRIQGQNMNHLRVRVRLNGEWHPNGRSSATVDLQRLEMTEFVRADTQPFLLRLRNQMYPLHSGYGMSPLYMGLVFIAGLGGIWLSVTGLIALLRRYKLL
ncbi:PepSY-associated TM helix domain-containing protein [Teredinibacter haidensis]|uniref:PepSY-associated TM helix domain-containing protein n=1 Tax=Teredinibacter haidensis TaxID=2731755 RepID=UPI000948DEF2|nr:PepSY-associated TM helix domain-containing protein [Teredinibacter haidensis]